VPRLRKYNNNKTNQTAKQHQQNNKTTTTTTNTELAHKMNRIENATAITLFQVFGEYFGDLIVYTCIP